MQTFIFKTRRGQGLALCDATRPPRGGSWQRQHFTRGQASLFVQGIPAHELRSLKYPLGSRYRIGALNPAAGLAQLLESQRLSLYHQRPRAFATRAKPQTGQNPHELRRAISASLKLIIGRERAVALAIAKGHQQKGRAGKVAAHTTALGQGLLASGADLLSWLANINDVVNPLWQLKRRIDAALTTYEECTGASNSCLDIATRANYLQRVELADHRELVEALGFDPQKIDLDAFSQAWHSAWVLAGDEQVVTMMSGFARDYIDAQHALEYSRAAGGAVFEVLLALLLAATTAGPGVAVGVASKGRHAGELGRIGKKLMLLAGALEDLPRGIVRRRGKTTRVVDGGGSNDRKGRTSQESEKPERQAPADKVAVLPAKLAANKKPPASDKKKPYSDPKNRPKYAEDQVEDVWDNAKQPDGNVYDPNTGELLKWDKDISRAGQWDMGHKPGHEYRKSHKDYMDGKISKEEFLSGYKDPNNYQPESASANRSHKYETE